MRARVTLVACLLIAFGIGQSHCPIQAADTSAAGQSKVEKSQTDREKPARKKALPAHYGSLGITDTQRAELQSVQEEYDARLSKLRDELKQLTQERDDKLEKHLTQGQRLRLRELRENSRSKKAQGGDKPATAKAEK